jgi:type III restriction enzyme
MIRKSEVVTTKVGLETELRSARDEFIEHSHDRLPDLIGYLQSKTELTRGTLARIIIESGRIGEIDKNPQEFLEQTLESYSAGRCASSWSMASNTRKSTATNMK